MRSIDIRTSGDLASEFESTICTWLREFNQTANPVWWKATSAPSSQAAALFVIATDCSDLVGGLIGSTSLKWLRIDLMAVKDDSRRQGIGRLLVEAAEKEAIKRGCHYSFVDTMEYQAPEFYGRCGYKVAGEIPDWDSHQHRKFFLTKNLSS
ncbi:GNAT family N-acetyltransferase [Rhodopirellula sp. MGV]|uniref:GNAT family N-acetyltransferase n=1 Tax=Rhodopirellula sp. MGV TaxID=2023130 RepID=UPI000B96F194|nr:GNAT family N-acetyltransferase [Rhodopirellula sp. MGV]OYP36664.1 hypothetical protein CGZ80_07720 [Rhodopirellula sp. MGV]PNY36093.1 N-acetyltransferase [Rhodopirellula baltica]PNY36115.1 N-acetyltransferase [Rhodopirellula baltica]